MRIIIINIDLNLIFVKILYFIILDNLFIFYSVSTLTNFFNHLLEIIELDRILNSN